MRQLLTIFLLILFNICYSQIDTKADFKISKFNLFSKLITDSPNDYLIKKINPASNYKYWEYVRVSPLEKEQKLDTKIIVFNGDKLKYADTISQIKSLSGFFYDCFPDMNCFNYIRAITENDSIELIDTETKFIKFIGTIQNIEEASLIIKLNGYGVDNIDKKIGSFRETKDSFYLYLLEEKKCTQKTIRAILYKTGEFIVIDNNIYKQIKPCMNY